MAGFVVAPPPPNPWEVDIPYQAPPLGPCKHSKHLVFPSKKHMVFVGETRCFSWEIGSTMTNSGQPMKVPGCHHRAQFPRMDELLFERAAGRTGLRWSSRTSWCQAGRGEPKAFRGRESPGPMFWPLQNEGRRSSFRSHCHIPSSWPHDLHFFLRPLMLF